MLKFAMSKAIISKTEIYKIINFRDFEYKVPKYESKPV